MTVGTASTVVAAVASQIATFLLFDVAYPSTGSNYYSLIHLEVLELKNREIKHTIKSYRLLAVLNDIKSSK